MATVEQEGISVGGILLIFADHNSSKATRWQHWLENPEVNKFEELSSGGPRCH